MSESKHTEGPWEARSARVYDASGEEVAVATRASSRNRKHANANARLIAAAPTMYEFVAARAEAGDAAALQIMEAIHANS